MRTQLTEKLNVVLVLLMTQAKQTVKLRIETKGARVDGSKMMSKFLSNGEEPSSPRDQ